MSHIFGDNLTDKEWKTVLRKRQFIEYYKNETNSDAVEMLYNRLYNLSECELVERVIMATSWRDLKQELKEIQEESE